MRDLVIMPAMAQRRESLNMGEFAEEAIIVEEVAAPKYGAQNEAYKTIY